ncbi:helix-turn-helix transcriptional regulator [Thalassomonas viridans]|uniref:Helix-turn-helix transcriptional regulator n=1 Tax=Thalassomonas viridans TaxID=137584 RepID=A0AAE9Z2X4_9GAMM|nr:helix-turn-helix transcriptional regulator [Thalassomonas viridans]WDE05075.1 helix-turn-helix transcriptional regulator [Thalassomonas viridans]
MTGDDLRRMRLYCNRTSEEMAKKISVSLSTYEKYEAGLEQPKASHLLVLNLYCRLSLTPLLIHIRELINYYNPYKDFKNDKTNSNRISAKQKHHKPEPEESEHE